MPDKDYRPINPEIALEEQRFGILTTDLSLERFTDLLRIYDEVSGSNVLINAEDVDINHWFESTLHLIGSRGRSEFRFGSRLSGHSKFEANLRDVEDDQSAVEFSLYANLGSQATDEEKAAGEAMQLEYRKRTNQYFIEKGIGINLEEKPKSETEAHHGPRKIYPWSISATMELGWGFDEDQLMMLQYDDLDFLADWLNEKSYGIIPAILEIRGHGNDRRAVELARKVVELNPEHRRRFEEVIKSEDALRYWFEAPLELIPAEPSEISGPKEFIH